MMDIKKRLQHPWTIHFPTLQMDTPEGRNVIFEITKLQADALKEIERLEAVNRDLFETSSKAIQNIEKKHQWIPVDERLPEKSGCYLVIVNDGLNNPVCEIISYRNSLWNIFDHEKVTHWMPLPELPE